MRKLVTTPDAETAEASSFEEVDVVSPEAKKPELIDTTSAEVIKSVDDSTNNALQNLEMRHGQIQGQAIGLSSAELAIIENNIDFATQLAAIKQQIKQLAHDTKKKITEL